MADYIRREDAEEALLFGMVFTGYQSQALDCIRFIGAADVRENVRGEWLHKQNNEGEWICSLCTADLAFVYGRESGLPNFCPNCGADMRGEKDV